MVQIGLNISEKLVLVVHRDLLVKIQQYQVQVDLVVRIVQSVARLVHLDHPARIQLYLDHLVRQVQVVKIVPFRVLVALVALRAKIVRYLVLAVPVVLVVKTPLFLVLLDQVGQAVKTVL
jgi:hypothetical protein